MLKIQTKRNNHATKQTCTSSSAPRATACTMSSQSRIPTPYPNVREKPYHSPLNTTPCPPSWRTWRDWIRSSVCVCPSLLRSGIQNKVLEKYTCNSIQNIILCNNIIIYSYNNWKYFHTKKAHTGSYFLIWNYKRSTQQCCKSILLRQHFHELFSIYIYILQ